MTIAGVDLPIAPSGSDPVPLVFWVPADSALAMQAQLAQLLMAQPGSSSGGGAYNPPFSNTHGPKDAWQLPPWKGDERDAAKWILDSVADNQRRVLAYIVSAGTDGVWTIDLRQRAGYDSSKSMSGVFKAIGGRFRRVGLRPLWNGGPKEPHKGQLLNVRDDNAQRLFASLLRSHYPELATEFNIV